MPRLRCSKRGLLLWDSAPPSQPYSTPDNSRKPLQINPPWLTLTFAPGAMSAANLLFTYFCSHRAHVHYVRIGLGTPLGRLHTFLATLTPQHPWGL